MIRNRKDLKFYLSEDYNNYNDSSLLKKIVFSNENLDIIFLLKSLRYYEYYVNRKKTVFNIIPFLCYRFLFFHFRKKTHIYITPNSLGPGVHIVHPGFIRIGSIASIGKYCTILPMVLLGKKRPGINGKIEIGDNCYISSGVSILGPVKIGNNVTIGAGAVVVKDIPDNCIVGGVPAKIL